MVQSLFKALFLFSLISASWQRVEDTHVNILYSWKYPDWTYASEEARQVAQGQNRYIPENGVILDSDYYFSPTTSLKRVFVTTPQFRSGIPATLSEVTREQNNGQILLSPFPSWEAQSQTTCDGPSSVYRINIDKCGLLWVLDTGRVETFVNPRRACRPKLLIYDLNNNDVLLVRYEFPDGTINDRSNLINTVIESYQNDCRDSVAYIADVNACGLVVYDMAHATSWRVENNYFYPFPHKGTTLMNGVTFDLMDGIFGIALSPPTDKERKLYFHAYASAREGWIPVRSLRDSATATNSSAMRTNVYISDEVRDGQSTLEVMTEDGILIYTVLPKNAIYCWNQETAFRKENQQLVFQDNENLQFISGLKLKGDQLLITSSKLQNYINGDLNTNDVKYRIIIIDSVEKLLKGTICKKGYGSHSTSSIGAGQNSGYHQGQGPVKPTRPSFNFSFPPRPTKPVH